MDNSKFIKEHECPSCGGSVIFVPETGKLRCEYCGTEFEVKEEKTAPDEAGTAGNAADNAAEASLEPVIEGFDFKKFYESAEIKSDDALPIYSCKSCGAEVIAALEEASLTCPYCTNKIVLTDKMSGSLRPNGVIPFRIPKKELKAYLDSFYKDKKLLPKNFFSEAVMERVTGVYVPYWLFSGKLKGIYKYDCSTQTSTESGDQRVTTTRYYKVERDAEMGFANIPIDASDKLDDSLMDSVLPYDLNELRDYSPDYLAGFAADRFDVPGEKLQERADSLMKKTVSDYVEKSLASSYSSSRLKSVKLNVDDVTVKYVLLPAYFFNIRFKKKRYGFALNGQTGKLVGNLPIDKDESGKYFLIRFGITAGIIMGAFIISYFTGGAI